MTTLCSDLRTFAVDKHRAHAALADPTAIIWAKDEPGEYEPPAGRSFAYGGARVGGLDG